MALNWIWQRHAFHLPADDAYRLRYALTDLMQAIRQQTDQIAEERGRPFHVAVRVATTFEACRRIGYDVETWVRDGLCDVVISGGNSGTDPGAEVEQFVELCPPPRRALLRLASTRMGGSKRDGCDLTGRGGWIGSAAWRKTS